jgi:hypothetical protein
MAAPSLDVTARGIDLFTVLTNATKTGKVFMEIGRWLGIEGLGQQELEVCLSQARDLVHANEECEPFYRTVTANTKFMAVMKDFGTSGTAGSLGGMMARDQHLRWLTSTVAGLMQFHDEDHVRQTMLVFLLQAGRASGTPLLSRDSIKYNPDGMTITPVLGKLVNSIWFYITNSSTAKSGIDNILPLPDSLRNLCPCKSGHYLDCHRLGNCLALIREAPDHEMVIESEYMIKDLVWWLWYHFTGSLRVVVAAEIVAKRGTGHDDSRIIEMRVGRPVNGKGMLWTTC